MMVEKLPLMTPFGNPFGVLAHTVKAEDLVRFQKDYGQRFCKSKATGTQPVLPDESP